MAILAKGVAVTEVVENKTVFQKPRVETNTAGQCTLLSSSMQTKTSLESAELPQSTPDTQLVQRELLPLDLDLTISQSNLPLGGRVQFLSVKLEENHKRPISSEHGCRPGGRMGNCSKSFYRKQKVQFFAQIERQQIEQEIQAMLEKQAKHKTQNTQPQFVGYIFFQSKNNGGMRPVFNMKKLNEYITYQHFKMEDLAVLKTQL